MEKPVAARAAATRCVRPALQTESVGPNRRKVDDDAIMLMSVACVHGN